MSNVHGISPLQGLQPTGLKPPSGPHDPPYPTLMILLMSAILVV